MRSSAPAVFGQVERLFTSDFGRSRPLTADDVDGPVQKLATKLVEKLHISY